MNNRGQALVEFILIMPIFIFIFLAIFDFGNYIYQRYVLENELDTVINMYNSDDTTEVAHYASEIGAKVKYEESGNYNKITLSKQVNIMTPIVSSIMGKTQEISSSRIVIIEDKIKENNTIDNNINQEESENLNETE